jgi:hypothetical protein
MKIMNYRILNFSNENQMDIEDQTPELQMFLEKYNGKKAKVWWDSHLRVTKREYIRLSKLCKIGLLNETRKNFYKYPEYYGYRKEKEFIDYRLGLK